MREILPTFHNVNIPPFRISAVVFYQGILHKYGCFVLRRWDFPTLVYLLPGYNNVYQLVLHQLLPKSVKTVVFPRVYFKFDLFFRKYAAYSTSLHNLQLLHTAVIKDTVSLPGSVQPKKRGREEPLRVKPAAGPAIPTLIFSQHQTALTVIPGSISKKWFSTGIKPRNVHLTTAYPGASIRTIFSGSGEKGTRAMPFFTPPGVPKGDSLMFTYHEISQYPIPTRISRDESGIIYHDTVEAGDREYPPRFVKSHISSGIEMRRLAFLHKQKAFPLKLQRDLAGDSPFPRPVEMIRQKQKKSGFEIEEPGGKESPAEKVKFPVMPGPGMQKFTLLQKKQIFSSSILLLQLQGPLKGGDAGLVLQPRYTYSALSRFQTERTDQPEKISRQLKPQDPDFQEQLFPKHKRPGDESGISFYTEPVEMVWHDPRKPERAREEPGVVNAAGQETIGRAVEKKSGTIPGEPARPAVSQEPVVDLNRLTDQVYRLLERKIRDEKERRGW